MRRSVAGAWPVLAALAVLASCAGDDSPGSAGETPPATEVDDDDAPPAGDDDLDDLLTWLDVDEYLAFEPVRQEPGPAGYVRYYFDTQDVRCWDGKEANVAVSVGTANKVMLFLEGGGARWPGGGFAVRLDFPWDMGFKSRAPENPLRDWSFVYVPYCDAGIHSGDNRLEYDGAMRWHDGVRQVAAAVGLMKRLFPDPEKLLVAGSSAGGFGTFLAWGVAKSRYRDTPTYVMNDSGVGFWNPERPETWDLIRETWNIRIPPRCVKCGDIAALYLYELYQDLDPQVRIGMFTSYRDFLISGWFLDIDPDLFQELLLRLTGDLRAAHPDRFARFFIAGNTHTCYEFMLPGGPLHSIRGTSLYTWIGQLVNDDPAWADLLE